MALARTRTGLRDLDEALAVIDDERRIKTIGALVGVAGMLIGLMWLVWTLG